MNPVMAGEYFIIVGTMFLGWWLVRWYYSSRLSQPRLPAKRVGSPGRGLDAAPLVGRMLNVRGEMTRHKPPGRSPVFKREHLVASRRAELAGYSFFNGSAPAALEQAEEDYGAPP